MAKLKLLHPDAEMALNELIDVMKGIQYVRNNVAHAVVTDDSEGGAALKLHSKQRSLTVEQIFSTEELTNYAAHAALALRFALGFDSGDSARHPLPDRPEIPEFLRELIPIRKK